MIKIESILVSYSVLECHSGTLQQVVPLCRSLFVIYCLCRHFGDIVGVDAWSRLDPRSRYDEFSKVHELKSVPDSLGFSWCCGVAKFCRHWISGVDMYVMANDGNHAWFEVVGDVSKVPNINIILVQHREEGKPSSYNV